MRAAIQEKNSCILGVARRVHRPSGGRCAGIGILRRALIARVANPVAPRDPPKVLPAILTIQSIRALTK
jgi:hypothetical protein